MLSCVFEAARLPNQPYALPLNYPLKMKIALAGGNLPLEVRKRYLGEAISLSENQKGYLESRLRLSK